MGEGEGGKDRGGGSTGKEAGVGGVVVTAVEFYEAGVGEEGYGGGYDAGGESAGIVGEEVAAGGLLGELFRVGEYSFHFGYSRVASFRLRGVLVESLVPLVFGYCTSYHHSYCVYYCNLSIDCDCCIHRRHHHRNETPIHSHYLCHYRSMTWSVYLCMCLCCVRQIYDLFPTASVNHCPVPSSRSLF